MIPEYCGDAEVLVRVNESTNPSFGTYPERRDVNTHIRYGFVNVDKPRGPTSHEVVSWVKRLFGLERAGHSGTLDPGVSGVLPIALGESTRVLQAISKLDKEYVMVLKLHGDVDDEKLRNVVTEFIGEIYQRPPLRSAVKRQLRVRRVYGIDIVERNGRYVLMRIRVESGTYARKLAYDIGEVLGVGASMRELRRVRVGCFTEDEAYSLHDLRDAYTLWVNYGVEDVIRDIVKPVEYMIKHLPKVWVRDSAVDAICHGASLAVPGVAKLTSNITRGSLVAMMTLKNELISLGIAEMSSSEIMSSQRGIAVRTTRVIMRRGTYPPTWRRSARSQGRTKG